MTSSGSFIEVDSCQRAKNGQFISGDVFLSRKVEPEGRMITVLSDGLGSGVKASLSQLVVQARALRPNSLAQRSISGTPMAPWPKR